MILFAFSKIMWRWDFEDAEKLFDSNSERGTVIICNHTSMAEVIAIVAHIWAKGHRVRPIFKSEFNKTKIVKWAFSRVGGLSLIHI